MKMLVFNLAALAALLPAFLLPLMRPREPGEEVRDLVFWAVLVAAIAGAGSWTWATFASGWQVGMAPALWVTIATSYVLFCVIALTSAPFARLLPLFGGYAVVLGSIATIWAHAPTKVVHATAAEAWLNVHIGVSVMTYALLTLSAVAALGVFLQERALKARRPTRLTAILPSVSEAESLQLKLLCASAIVLGLGLASGMVIEFLQEGTLLSLSHKVLLSFLAFAVIVFLLLVHRLSGLAGRRAARLLLLAYLLLTLGYPGVKFVTDVIIG